MSSFAAFQQDTDLQSLLAESSISNPEYRFNFGKYNGKRLSAVPASYIDFLVKKNVAAGRPDLKVALDTYSSTYANNSVHATRATIQNSNQHRGHVTYLQRCLSPAPPIHEQQPYNGDRSRTPGQSLMGVSLLDVKIESSIAPLANVPSREVYEVHFGRHEGKTLDEVPVDFVIRLKKLIDFPGFKQATPQLRDALREFKVPHEERLAAKSEETKEERDHHGQSNIKYQDIKKEEKDDKKPSIPPRKLVQPKPQPPPTWTRPSIFLARFDSRFYDEWDQTPVWISTRDAQNYFGLRNEHLNQIPPIDSNARMKKYHLYFVWDFFKSLMGKGKADEALTAFLGKNKRREDEILGSLGLVRYD